MSDKAKRHAFLSVTDKTGITDLAQDLTALGFTIHSSGGTAKTLKQMELDIVTYPDLRHAAALDRNQCAQDLLSSRRDLRQVGVPELRARDAGSGRRVAVIGRDEERPLAAPDQGVRDRQPGDPGSDHHDLHVAVSISTRAPATRARASA